VTVNEASTYARSLTVDKRYGEICSSVRAADGIRLKLLGLVPLLSAVGVFLLLDPGAQPNWSLRTVLIALFGAVIAFAIYLWEIGNLRLYRWLVARGAELERDELGLPQGQFHNREPAPRLFGRRMGRTEAEHLLYWATIGAWLLLALVATVNLL
jgi:uncharacterized membrane protein YeaQ/YmgE (transglycosylase-associated protein family)